MKEKACRAEEEKGPDAKAGERKRTLWTFAGASFLNDMGSDMIYPIWPIFVTSFLGAPMSVLGLLDGLGEALVSISKAVSGYASDRIGRRKVFVWSGYLMGAASRLGYAAAFAWPLLIPFRILDRSGKIRSAPRDAIIADISTRENRGGSFGLLRTMDNLGAVVGILICILLLGWLGYRNLFMLASIPSVIGAALIFLLIKERRRGKGGKAGASGTRTFKRISLRDLNGNFKLLLFLSGVFALGSFSYSFLLVFAHEAGFRVFFVPVLYLVFTAVASLLSWPFGKLADRAGRKKVLLLSYLLWGLVCLILLLFDDYVSIVAVFLLFGMHKAALEPVQKAFVSELAPRRLRASALGGFQMVIGLCALPSSLVAGLLWDNIGRTVPFLVSLCLTAAAGAMLLFVKER